MLCVVRAALVALASLSVVSLGAADAHAIPFATPTQVERFELSGGATFVDDFDNATFPEAPWFVACGSASEAGGALSVDDAAPSVFCPVPLFLAGPTLFFTTSTTATADFRAVLPAEGEFVGIQIGTPDAGDLVNLSASRAGGSIFLGVSDETGLLAAFVVDPLDYPAFEFRLQIALALDVPSGILIATVGASADGNPLLTQVLPAFLGLDTNALVDEAYGAVVIAGFLPEPATAALLLPVLLPLLGAARRAPAGDVG